MLQQDPKLCKIPHLQKHINNSSFRSSESGSLEKDEKVVKPPKMPEAKKKSPL